MATLAPRLRRIWTASDAMREAGLLALVIAATLAPELMLAERKYGIFGGGFGQSQALTGASSVALFALVLLACHGFLFSIVFLSLRWLHRRIGKAAVFPINFLLLVPAAWAGALAAKYEVLAYFSDAISFQLIRNLGGGSLFDALLFVLSDGALIGVAIIAGLAAYWLLLRRWMRSRSGRAGSGGLDISGKWLVAAALAVAALLYVGNMRDEVRSALGRFNAVWLSESLLGPLTDFDRDGYGLFTHPTDPWPFDGSRYPFALDVPGNGTDEDGIGGDFRAAPAGAALAAAPVFLPKERKHLIIVVLESTRADALGRSVGGHRVMPNVAALASAGSSFPAAYSHVGFTTASLKSLFSGRLETQAGGPSLFRDLKANGYRIGVFSGQPESFGDISEAVAMKASADVFRDAETLKDERAFGFAAKGSLLVDGKVLLREFDRSFGHKEDWSRPVFLYFNLQSAHFPYHHPGMEQILPGRPIPRGQIDQSNRGWVEATYWNAVAQADSQIGALVARLKALGVYDESLILVTADHGESLFDDGFLGHGHSLNRQQTQIPLVVNVPGVARSQPVGLADYRGLILRLLGAKVPAPADHPVLQYIGTLDRPAYVGSVDAQGRWTVLEPDERKVRFDGAAFDYDGLGTRPELKARADALVQAWEQARWERHKQQ